MAALNTPNADLEQALFKANLKERRLRQRVVLIALVPAAIGALWLLYSLYEVTTWQTRAAQIAEREAATQQRENDAHQQVADADAKRTAAEAAEKTAQAAEKAAKARADDMQQRLVKARAEIGGLAPLLAEVSSIKAKASKLNASEAVETDLTEIRTTLGRTLGRIEQEIDKGLPSAEQKARVYLFYSDDTQRDTAKALVPILEGAGFDASLAKNPGRKMDATEIRYFHEAQDKADAARIQALVAAQPGQTDCRLNPTSDSDHATGSRKFQVWFGKPAIAPR